MLKLFLWLFLKKEVTFWQAAFAARRFLSVDSIFFSERKILGRLSEPYQAVDAKPVKKEHYEERLNLREKLTFPVAVTLYLFDAAFKVFDFLAYIVHLYFALISTYGWWETLIWAREDRNCKDTFWFETEDFCRTAETQILLKAEIIDIMAIVVRLIECRVRESNINTKSLICTLFSFA